MAYLLPISFKNLMASMALCFLPFMATICPFSNSSEIVLSLLFQDAMESRFGQGKISGKVSFPPTLVPHSRH
jgi:hypothetical protein